jgi:SNF2 family DNA or RNA helicase
VLQLLDRFYEEIFGDGLVKAAKAEPPVPQRGMKTEFKPFPHQQQAIDLFLQNDGKLIMAHGTGAGKTLGAIFAFDAGRKIGIAQRALVVVPTGLRRNFAKSGIKKGTHDTWQVFGNKGEVKDGTHVSLENADPEKSFSIIGYEMFRKDPVGYMKAAAADTLIMDEVHKIKSPSSLNYQSAMLARSVARNFIGLTGSVVSNRPGDLAPLLNVTVGYPIAGTPTQFDRRYVKVIGTRKSGIFGGEKKVKVLAHGSEIKQRFGSFVHFVGHDDLDPALFPKKTSSDIDIEMSDEQQQLYQFAMGQLPFWVRDRIRRGLPVGQKEAQLVFTKILQARQAANSIHVHKAEVTPAEAAERTPKIKKILDDATNHLATTPDGQIVMYSNLVKGGIDVLAAGLKTRGVKFGIFAGKGREIAGRKIEEESRQEAVDDYLANKNRVILVSGAGAEGLDLKNTTMVQMVDGHFNPEVIQQAEARGRRVKGLWHRPPEKRMVVVKRYRSVMPKPHFLKRMVGISRDSTTDEWIYRVAKEKNVLNSQLRRALKGEAPKRIKLPEGFKPLRSRRTKKYTRRWKVWTARGPEWRYAYN